MKVDQSEIRRVKDPVCGYEFDPREGVQLDYSGKTYYFCDEIHRNDFIANPETYPEAPA